MTGDTKITSRRSSIQGVASSYVPRWLIDRLSGHVLPPPWVAEIEGTLLMADISGFTALSEQLQKQGREGAERLTEIINRFFTHILRIAVGYGADILGYGGDAVLLLFEGEAHAARAAGCGLDMLQVIEKSAPVTVGKAKVKLGMSIGAHSSEFMATCVGTPDRQHVLLVGEASEETARAEAKASRGQMFVTAPTARLIGESCCVEDDPGYWSVRSSPSIQSGARDGRDQAEEEPESSATRVPGLDKLRPHLPPWVADALEADDGRTASPPEHRRVSIAFVNVTGIDEMQTTEGTQAARDELQKYFVCLMRALDKHQGYLLSSDIATHGFKFILTFGAPVAHEYAAANAARFALEFNESVQSGATGRLRHRIGLNCGHVFAGEVGPDFRRQYTVMGDEVNLTARLMAAAEPGQIMASASFIQNAGPTFCAQELEPIRVKGKEEPVAVCVLDAEEAEVSAATAVGGALVGRKQELASILDSWQEARSGEGRTVVIEGDPGVGKSRLLQEVMGSMGDATRITHAACHEHLRAVPFTPWLEVVSSVCGVSDEMPEHDRTALVEQRLHSAAPDLDEFGSLLNPLMDLRIPSSDVATALDARTRRERLFALISRLIAAAGHERGARRGYGHVVVIEDAHWADESSLALMTHLASRVAHEPVLLLVTRRPDGPSILTGDRSMTVVLGELGLSESSGLVRGALGIPDLPDELTEIIHAKTRGNPLFLEEVIHSLQEPGLLERILSESSMMRAQEMASLEIPDRVQGLLMSRIDRLPADTREVLKAASVLGRTVDRQVLEGLDDPQLRAISLDQAFAELARSALMSPDPQDSPTSYVFRHALVQEVAYESLPYARRKGLHSQVAHRLEEKLTPVDHGLLVHHYRSAGDGPNTLVHASKAAEAATEVYAFAEAVDYLDLARDQVRSRSSSSACLRSRLDELAGDSLESVARHEEAVDRYIEARRRLRRIDEEPALDRVPADSLRVEDPAAWGSDLCRKIAVALERRHAAYRRALRWLDRAEDDLPPGRLALEAGVQVTRGVVEFRLGHYQESLHWGEEGLKLAREVGDDALQAYALAMLANPCVGLGLIPRAIEASEEAVALYARVKDIAGQASAEANLAACYQLAGNFLSALEHQEAALKLHQRLGYQTGVAICRTNLGEVLIQIGRVDDAVDHLECVLEGWKGETLPAALIGFALVTLSRARLLQGEANSAQEALEKGRDLLRQANAEGLLLEADLQSAEVQWEQGHAQEAEDACLAVLDAARTTEARILETRCRHLLGRLASTRGNDVVASEHLAASADLAADIGARYERGLALLELARVDFRRSSDDREPLTSLDEAIGLFREMGAQRNLNEALQLREKLRASSDTQSPETWPNVNGTVT